VTKPRFDQADHPSAETSAQPGIQMDDNLFDFFYAHVGRAVEEHGKPVSEEGAWYLTCLLVDRAHPAKDADENKGETLVDLRLQATKGDRSQAIQAYRRLGDRALLTSGFFRQSLARRLVSRSYYIAMGAAAYDTLAGLLRVAGFGRSGTDRGAARGLDDIYDELAASFEACSEVLYEVSDAVREEDGGSLSDADIVALYEEWLATGSSRVWARLARLGVVPVRAADSKVC